MRSRSLLTTPLLLTVFALSGCAVLTVDVDVYKGPLSSDITQVRVDRLVGAAQATEPLLRALVRILEEKRDPSLLERILRKEPRYPSLLGVAREALAVLEPDTQNAEEKLRDFSESLRKGQGKGNEEVLTQLRSPALTGGSIKMILQTASENPALSQDARDAARAALARVRPSKLEQLLEQYHALRYEELEGHVGVCNPATLEDLRNAAPGTNPDEACDLLVRLLQEIVVLSEQFLSLATVDTLTGDTGSCCSGDDELRRLLRAIQAMGNSLQALAIEVRRNFVGEILLKGVKRAEEQDANGVIEAIKPGYKPESIAVDARLALDRAIMFMEYQRILALQQGKPDVEQLDAAIDAAYDRRAGMQALTPASAYLRTSFPAAAYQRDARLTSTNLLDDQLQRLVPDWLIQKFPLRGDISYQALQEVDKQFWQNINTIRVAGAGDVNYVVAKDDIGNWYVKQVSTNVEDIVRAAQSLALFGVGGSLGADLVNIPRGDEPTTTEQAQQAAGSSRESAQGGRFLALYTSQTAAERGVLKAGLERLLSDLGALLGTEGLGGVIGAAKKELEPALAALGGASADVHEMGDQITGAIRTVDSFYASAVALVRARVDVPGAVLALNDAEGNLEQARARLAEAEAGLADAQAEADRLRALGDEGATLRAAEAGVLAAKKPVANRQRDAVSAEARVADLKRQLASKRRQQAFALRVLAEHTRNTALTAVQRRISAVQGYRTAVSVLGNLTPADL